MKEGRKDRRTEGLKDGRKAPRETTPSELFTPL